MPSAVMGDHIKFIEAIEAFSINQQMVNTSGVRFYSYLLLDFNLTNEWNFNDFDILPTIDGGTNLNPSPYKGFVTPVLLPSWVLQEHGTLYTIGLSAIISFCSGRPIKSLKDVTLVKDELLDTSSAYEVAVQYPVVSYGSGARNFFTSDEAIEKYQSNIQELCNILNTLPDKDYHQIFQSIRLVHLALINKRDDFDLGFSLLVAAIESIAQKAIIRDSLVDLDTDEKAIESLIKGNPALENWFKTKILKQAKLKARYVDFIFRYAPINSWEELEHPLESFKNPSVSDWLTSKKFNERYAEDFSQDEIKKIIGNTYDYRSNFLHVGKGTPHSNPLETNRFFEEIRIPKKVKPYYKEEFIPKFELMLKIAQIAIMEYARSLVVSEKNKQ